MPLPDTPRTRSPLPPTVGPPPYFAPPFLSLDLTACPPSQVEGQGSLGRSIDNKDPDGGDATGGGGGGPDALLHPALPGTGAGGHRVSPPLPPTFRQRAHSDPPFVPPRVSTGNRGDGVAAEPLPAGTAGEPVPAVENGTPTAAAAPATTTAAWATAEAGEGEDSSGPGDGAVPPEATMYPEVLLAVGLDPERAAIDPAARHEPEREAEDGGGAKPVGDGGGGRGTKAEGGSGGRTGLSDQDLVLPEPLREEGPTGDQQASDVADVLFR